MAKRAEFRNIFILLTAALEGKNRLISQEIGGKIEGVSE